MNDQHITVVYKWTAKPGNLDKLAEIYSQVTEQMKENEPGAEAVHVFVSEAENAVYVRDEFVDAAAMGFHLQPFAFRQIHDDGGKLLHQFQLTQLTHLDNYIGQQIITGQDRLLIPHHRI